MTFELDLTDLPAIYRDGKSSSLDKIKSGDTVVVTVRYNKVTTLETTPQSANVTGTITRVVQDAAGITFDVKLTDGSTASYTVSEGVSVTQDGTAVSLYTLKPNDAVAMVVSGGDVGVHRGGQGLPAPAASLRARSWCPTPRTRP
mgnify:CR=1 FL=1